MQPESTDQRAPQASLEPTKRSLWGWTYALSQDGRVVGRLRRGVWSSVAAAETGRDRWRMRSRGMASGRVTVTDEASGRVAGEIYGRTVKIHGGPTVFWRRLGHREGRGRGWVCVTEPGQEVIRARVTRGVFRAPAVSFTVAPCLGQRDRMLCLFLTSYLWLRRLERRAGAGAGAMASVMSAAGAIAGSTGAVGLG